MPPKKNTKVVFTVDPETKKMWDLAFANLKEHRLYQSRTELFEDLVYFIQLAGVDEIQEFQKKARTLII